MNRYKYPFQWGVGLIKHAISFGFSFFYLLLIIGSDTSDCTNSPHDSMEASVLKADNLDSGKIGGWYDPEKENQLETDYDRYNRICSQWNLVLRIADRL